MIQIDGSTGEGGGQVLRTALTLSVITGQPLEVRNIRAGRRRPGLRPQHLTAVQAAAAICKAEVEGAELESEVVRFIPAGPARPGSYTFDVAQIAGQGSAGAVGLVLQTILLPLALADGNSALTLRGGTHVPWAPSTDYIQRVLGPMLERMGVQMTLEPVSWGFYPAGGGEVRVHIQAPSSSLRPLQLLERGDLREVEVLSIVSNLPSHIPQRMVNRARNLLHAAGVEKVKPTPRRVRGSGPGAVALLFAGYERCTAGFTGFGRKGLPAERVAESACESFFAHHATRAPADPHLADQLILPMALAAGTSRVHTSAITRHLLTSLAVVRSFLPIEATVEGKEGSPGIITVRGSEYD